MEDKLDKIAEDTAYMRGKWDSTIPSLLARVDNLETMAVQNKVNWGKITALAGFLSFIGSSAVTYFTSRK